MENLYKLIMRNILNILLVTSTALLTACGGDSLPVKINLDGKTQKQLKPYASTSILLYMCGHYGEKSDSLTAPINYYDYYARARLILASYQEQQEESKRKELKDFEDGYFETLNETYLEGGPDILEKQIESALKRVEDTKLPKWISNCSDILNYSDVLINQAA